MLVDGILANKKHHLISFTWFSSCDRWKSRYSLFLFSFSLSLFIYFGSRIFLVFINVYAMLDQNAAQTISTMEPNEQTIRRRRRRRHQRLPNKTEADDLYGDISLDNIIDRTALDILEKLPKTFEIWRVKETLQMKLCPTGVVLLQELQRYNGLVERIQKTLKLLRKVCVTSK